MNDRGRTGPSDERISRLSAAILRISQSLDLATVLEEVVEGARALTGARSGVITTIDERGQVQDFVTSGLPPEERRMMLEWPDGPRLFEHLRDLATPLRVADLPGYLGSLGLSSNPWGAKTLQGTPMHHRGEHLGHFFLADKEDGEAFTAEDEEILVLFASQAATAIANARTHLDVERARASLEALVETSPVGVVVFDARTGRPVSFNREAQRIVEEIRTPGHPTEQLLEVMTFRHAERAGDLARGVSPGPTARGRPRRCAPRRSSCRCPTVGASGRSSTSRRSIRRRGNPYRSSSPCRILSRSRSWSGSGRRSSEW